MQNNFNIAAQPVMTPQQAGRELFDAIRSDNLPAVDALIHREQADVNSRRADGLTLLHYATDLKNDKAISMLLAAGADVHAVDGKGDSVLRHAMEADCEICVKKLIEAGADTAHASYAPKDGRELSDGGYATYFSFEIATAIHSVTDRFYLNHAASRGDTGWLRNLTAANTPVDTLDRFGKSALIWCCEKENAEGADVLLAAKADPNFCMKDGNGPLHLLAQNGDVELFDKIVTAGGDVRRANKAGKTPLDIAEAAGNRAVTEYMRDKLAAEDSKLVHAATQLSTPVKAMKQIRIAPRKAPGA